MGSTRAISCTRRSWTSASERGSGAPFKSLGMLGGDVDFISGGGAKRTHSCVKLVNGEVHCWGANSGAQLGLGHTENIGDDEEPDSEDQVRIIE